MAIEFKEELARHKKRRRETPLEYMLRVLNDETVPDDRRDRIAGMAAPYVHPKVIQGYRSKKATENQAALTAGKGTTWANDLDEIRAQ